jgi:hypothetical protein
MNVYVNMCTYTHTYLYSYMVYTYKYSQSSQNIFFTAMGVQSPSGVRGAQSPGSYLDINISQDVYERGVIDCVDDNDLNEDLEVLLYIFYMYRCISDYICLYIYAYVYICIHPTLGIFIVFMMMIVMI